MEEKTHQEEIRVSGEVLFKKVKELAREGNIRRIIIKNEKGRTLVDVPPTLGVTSVLLAPQLAAVGAIAAVWSKGTDIVEKVDN